MKIVQWGLTICQKEFITSWRVTRKSDKPFKEIKLREANPKISSSLKVPGKEIAAFVDCVLGMGTNYCRFLI